MLANPLFILEAIVGFSLLVFVHELGHFLAAKWMGIRVEAFSIGFGPCIRKKWRGTEYRLSVIPLGGYVKMAGEEPQPDKPPAPDEFYGKSVGQRAIVFAAGVVMNLIFGFVVFVVAYGLGVPVVPAIVGDVAPGLPAWKAGLMRGDHIVGINNISPPVDFEDLQLTTMLARKGRSIRLLVERDGRRLHKEVFPEYIEERGVQSIGISSFDTMTVGERPKENPENGLDYGAVFDAGLRTGDRVTAVQVEGQEEPAPVATGMELLFALQACDGKPVRISFARDGVAQEPVTLLPRKAGQPFWLLLDFGSNRVAAVREGSWAEQTGFREGDVVSSVAGKSVRSTSEVADALDALRDSKVVATVTRDGSPLEISVPPHAAGPASRDVLAFQIGLFVDRPLPGLSMEGAGLQPSDEIISANDKPVKNETELDKVIAEAKGDPIELVWRRGAEEMRAALAPQRAWVLPIPWESSQVTVRAGLVRSCVLGTRKASQWIVRIYGTLRGLLTGRISGRHLLGPITIARLSYAAAERGAGTLLYVLGVLSVNLGVINLLPIPVLDGGHLLFAVMEKARGRPVSERIRAVSSYVGLSLLIAIMLLAFWNDIRVLIFG